MRYPFAFLKKESAEELEARIEQIDNELKTVLELEKALDSKGGKIIGDVLTILYNEALARIGDLDIETREQSRYMIIAINKIKGKLDFIVNKNVKNAKMKELEELTNHRNKLRKETA